VADRTVSHFGRVLPKLLAWQMDLRAFIRASGA